MLPEFSTLKSKVAGLLREWEGPLTSDLVLTPGKFGLGRVPERIKPDGLAKSVCGFCSTGCSLNLHLRDGEAINLSPDPEHPVNLGMACPKGWEALAPLEAPDRATTPLLRAVDGTLKPVSWQVALDTFCDRFKSIQKEHGPASVAFLSTGQIACEEMALLGTLAKFGMGMLHGDGNTRQCMATAVTAYKESFGFDAPPFTYRDFEESDAIVLVGSNLCIAHPIMWQRVLQNRRNPEIIVVDPRKTETAMCATQHLAIAPKSDLIFLYGAARALFHRGAIDADFIKHHTTGAEEFRAFVETFTPEYVCETTRLPREVFDRFVETIATRKRVSFWWTMGVNQGHEATRTAQAIINLALMTGNIGRPGTGANSITGQCNAMGSRLFSNTTGLIGGHSFTDPAHRQKIAGILGIEETRIPQENSLAYDQILDGIETGAIKGLWVIATNTAHSWIHQNRANSLLRKLDFLVVQDMYSTTETAQGADLVLPAAGWGEKDGTLINSERRFGVIRKARIAPGQALSDFHIFRLIAHAWGLDPMFKEWNSPEAVFRIIREITRGQPCDITGIDGFEMIEKSGGIQWPLSEAQASQFKIENSKFNQERRLFEDGQFFTPDQKARFVFETPREAPERTSADYPFLLLTGRGSSAQWHTQTRTGKSSVLRKLYSAQCYVEIHPDDAARLSLGKHDKVRVRSARGELEATAFITPTVQPGQLFIPMHYAEANRLTFWAVDPYSRQPSYKACAVTVEKAATS